MAEGSGAMDLGAGVGDFVGSIIGEILSAGSREEAESLRLRAMQEYNIELPPLEHLESQAATAQGSPQAQATRMAALKSLSRRGAEGYNAEDRAAVSDTLSEVNQAARGRQQAITQGMDPNSGAAVAAQLGNAQSAAQVANKQGLQIAADSRRQALQALSQSGKFAGDIDADAFGQSYQRGQAGDAMSQFNERNKHQRVGEQFALADRRYGGLNSLAGGKDDEAERKKALARGGGRAVGAVGGAYLGS